MDIQMNKKMYTLIGLLLLRFVFEVYCTSEELPKCPQDFHRNSENKCVNVSRFIQGVKRNGSYNIFHHNGSVETKMFKLFEARTKNIFNSEFEILSNLDESVDLIDFSRYMSENNSMIKFMPVKVKKIFPNLTVYEITGCQLYNLKYKNFQGLTNLQCVQIVNNNLRSIDADAFDDLINLKEINAGQNFLKEILPSVFKNTKLLRQLKLADNIIESLHPSVFDALKELQILDLSENRLTELDKNIFKNLIKLEKLDLDKNRLVSFHPTVFQNLHELKEIYFSSNQLTSLSDEHFKHNHNMEVIWIRNNPLSSLSPSIIDGMNKLKYVDFEVGLCNGSTHSEVKRYGNLENLIVLSEKQRNSIKFDFENICDKKLESNASDVINEVFN